MATPSPILWQSPDASVTLLDIPHSIASAQHHSYAPLPFHLLSTFPLSAPFATNEPKSAAARAKLAGNSGDHGLHSTHYHPLLRRALEEVKAHVDGQWCLPRPFVEQIPRPAKRRRTHEEDEAAASVRSTFPPEERERTSLPDDLLASVARGDGSAASQYTLDLQSDQQAPSQNIQKDKTQRHFFSNNHTHPASLKISSTTQPTETFTFAIPPQSSFYIGDCTDSSSFRKAIRTQTQPSLTTPTPPSKPTTFDFILLDPPWPNRSVKNTHKSGRSAYTTAPNLSGIRDLLFDLRLDLLMSDSHHNKTDPAGGNHEGCLIGIWITNKSAIRDLILEPDAGLFACWGVELVEEWVWLKVTAGGEAVTPIDAVWRRPYEVLLLGRKRKAQGNSDGRRGGEMTPTMTERHDNQIDDGKDVKRRVIIGVPDLHSRKPCLKEIIEPLLLRDGKKKEGEGPRVLEVFARHLVAGWWSWGDECIKFNWTGYWRREDEMGQQKLPA